jgi:hypothetical protein
VHQDSDVPGIIAVIVALLLVCFALVGMHVYADRFAPKPVILEERSGQPNNGIIDPAERAGGSIRTT